MSFKKLSNNKYKISVELGYDILGNRKRKTEIFNGSFNDMKLREAELTKEYYPIGNVRNVNDLTFEQYSVIFLNKYCKEKISAVPFQCPCKCFRHSRNNPRSGTCF